MKRITMLHTGHWPLPLEPESGKKERKARRVRTSKCTCLRSDSSQELRHPFETLRKTSPADNAAHEYFNRTNAVRNFGIFPFARCGVLQTKSPLQLRFGNCLLVINFIPEDQKRCFGQFITATHIQTNGHIRRSVSEKIIKVFPINKKIFPKSSTVLTKKRPTHAKFIHTYVVRSLFNSSLASDKRAISVVSTIKTMPSTAAKYCFQSLRAAYIIHDERTNRIPLELPKQTTQTPKAW